MMDPTIKPKWRETAASLLSRLAAAYDVTTTDFARDMKISYKKLVNGDRDAIEAVAQLAGLSRDAEDELISWSGVVTGNVRTQFRGETIVSRALKSPIVRGCPTCLQEDAARCPDDPLTEMAMRGHWQFRHVTACVKHGLPLVALWSEPNVFRRFDAQAQLKGIRDALVRGKFDQASIELNGFDGWVENRLAGGQDLSWLASIGLYPTSTFCHHLGQVLFLLREGKVPGCVPAIREGEALAFEVVKNGQESVHRCLSSIVEKSVGEQLEPRKAFGPLFVTLSETYISDPSFDVFRDILRQCIIQNFPLEDGSIVLGAALPTRKLHSVKTAAAEAGIGSHLMAKLLEEAGAISKNRPFGPARTTFDALKYSPFIAEVATWVTQERIKDVLGATKQEFRALVSEGIIAPTTKVTSYAAVWRVSDATSFLEQLDKLSDLSDREAEPTIGIYAAHSSTKLPIKKIIALIEAGDIDLLQVQISKGIRNYAVPIVQLKRFQSMQPVAKKRQSASPAKFFRSIGMRNAADIRALIDHGYVKTSCQIEGNLNATKPFMSNQDIAEFHQKFCTLTTLESSTGLHRNSLRALLAKHSVKPFSIGGETIQGLFLVADVEPALEGRYSTISSFVEMAPHLGRTE